MSPSVVSSSSTGRIDSRGRAAAAAPAPAGTRRGRRTGPGSPTRAAAPRGPPPRCRRGACTARGGRRARAGVPRASRSRRRCPCVCELVRPRGQVEAVDDPGVVRLELDQARPRVEHGHRPGLLLAAGLEVDRAAAPRHGREPAPLRGDQRRVVAVASRPDDAGMLVEREREVRLVGESRPLEDDLRGQLGHWREGTGGPRDKPAPVPGPTCRLWAIRPGRLRPMPLAAGTWPAHARVPNGRPEDPGSGPAPGRIARRGGAP